MNSVCVGKDKAGNEFVCRVMDLKDPKKVDEKEPKEL